MNGGVITHGGGESHEGGRESFMKKGVTHVGGRESLMKVEESLLRVGGWNNYS